MQYALFQTTSYGFVKQTFNAIVDGITKVCFLSTLNLDNFR